MCDCDCVEGEFEDEYEDVWCAQLCMIFVCECAC